MRVDVSTFAAPLAVLFALAACDEGTRAPAAPAAGRGAAGQGGVPAAQPSSVSPPIAGSAARPAARPAPASPPTAAAVPVAGRESAASKPEPADEDAGMTDSRPDTAAVQANGRPVGFSNCYTELSSNHPASREFRRSFVSGDYAARDATIEPLAAAAAAYPNEQEFTFLLAFANLWRAAERQGLQDSLVAFESAQVAEREFARAYALCPSDGRIPAWLGPTKMLLAELTGDPALRAEGEKVILDGIEHYPAMGMFGPMVGYVFVSTDSPEFRRVVDAARYYRAMFMDSDDAYCRRTGDPICTNLPEVPHNIEGTALYVGDVFLRAQDREAALEAYQLAKLSPDWASWRFREVLEDRIQHIDAHLESLDNALSLDDPEWAWFSTSQCMYCHQR